MTLACALAGIERNDQSHGSFRAEDITVEEQIDRLGFGRFQMIVLVALFALKVSDGMELATGNFIWRGIGETPGQIYLFKYMPNKCHLGMHGFSQCARPANV